MMPLKLECSLTSAELIALAKKATLKSSEKSIEKEVEVVEQEDRKSAKKKDKKRKREDAVMTKEAKKNKAIDKVKDAEAAVQAWLDKASASPSPSPRGVKEQGSGNKPFSRVDTSYWNSQIKEGLEDNSYMKAFGDDGYGAKASAKLMTVQGKDFKHEKTKKKRGSYRGGIIDMSSQTKSFKYDSD